MRQRLPLGIGIIETALREAGFRDVLAERTSAPLRLSGASECARFQRESFGALHQMLSSLDEREQSKAWEEVASALRGFEGPQGFVGPCELIVVSGAK
jgi:hypothetical protein